jgi:hypothetical protein
VAGAGVGGADVAGAAVAACAVAGDEIVGGADVAGAAVAACAVAGAEIGGADPASDEAVTVAEPALANAALGATDAAGLSAGGGSVRLAAPRAGEGLLDGLAVGGVGGAAVGWTACAPGLAAGEAPASLATYAASCSLESG